jgi:hypothetical protein
MMHVLLMYEWLWFLRKHMRCIRQEKWLLIVDTVLLLRKVDSSLVAVSYSLLCFRKHLLIKVFCFLELTEGDFLNWFLI